MLQERERPGGHRKHILLWMEKEAKVMQRDPQPALCLHSMRTARDVVNNCEKLAMDYEPKALLRNNEQS